ncbi:MAG: hypothetical protein GY932_07860 [Arcobacter sp.]|nr:hypothetical protein [Arcobacter sp.]
MNKFTTETMFEIINIIRKKFLESNTLNLFEFEVLNPDLYKSSYSEVIILINDKKYI